MPEGESLVARVVREHREGLLRGEAEEMARMASKWLEMERSLAGQFNALALEIELIRASGKVPTLHKVMQLERYKDLLEQARDEVEKYVQYAEGEIKSAQTEWGRLGIEQGAEAIRTLQAENGIRVGFNVLPVRAIEGMVGLAGDGSPLKALLSKSYREAADGLLKVLREAILMGWGPQETARAMANGFGVGLNRAFRVARTEQLRVYREGSRMEYRASGLVVEYQRMAAKSVRTCMACLIADGRIYGIDEVFEEHPEGRCTLVPVLKGYPAASWETGRVWFERQPEAVQQQMMGAQPFAAWKDGRFGLDDLVTRRTNATWGAALQVTPMKELMELR